MKALLLKDFYQIKGYCRSVLLIAVGSLFSGENFFFITYPVVLMSLLPVTLLSYDERSHWNRFCGALPYSQAQVVSGKYLLGLLLTMPTILIMLILYALRTAASAAFFWSELLGLADGLLILGLCSFSLCMPLLLRFGVEKGRLIYYIVIGFTCASGFFLGEINLSFPYLAFPVILLLCAGVYALSWRIAIGVYETVNVRENIENRHCKPLREAMTVFVCHTLTFPKSPVRLRIRHSESAWRHPPGRAAAARRSPYSLRNTAPGRFRLPPAARQKELAACWRRPSSA